MPTYPSRHALQELGGAHGPNLCFLDLISDADRGLAVINELRAVQASIKILVLLSAKNPDIILRAMRAGAAEFLVRPFDADAFDNAIDRIASLERGGKGGLALGKVICMVPAKGACGATTIASNLAQHYKRVGFKKILLADLDPLTGTLSFLLKLKSSYSFTDALQRSHSMDTDIWKGIVTSVGPIDVLLSPETVNDGLHDLVDASAIVDFARSFYEVVILDTGTPYGDWNLSIARGADHVVLVSTNELPSLQAAQRALDYLENSLVEMGRIRLVINRYSKEHGLSREVIETALHTDIFHVLPSDYENVQRALIEGKPVPSSTDFGKSLTQLGDLLALRPKVAAAPRKSSAISTLLSLFAKPAK
ncbi:MAG: response regulator [Acidobacteria bacterium]|nr:response regulator [Acidobacteriota bacterium]